MHGKHLPLAHGRGDFQKAGHRCRDGGDGGFGRHAQKAAAKRGYDLSALRARTIEGADFRRFDLILAMDQEHHAILSRIAGSSAEHKLKLMMSYARRFKERDVPDPYYGGPQGFERMLDMLEDAAKGLLESLHRD